MLNYLSKTYECKWNLWVKNYIIYIYENAFDILLNKFNQKVFKEYLVNDIRYSWTPCINFKMLYLIILWVLKVVIIAKIKTQVVYFFCCRYYESPKKIFYIVRNSYNLCLATTKSILNNRPTMFEQDSFLDVHHRKFIKWCVQLITFNLRYVVQCTLCWSHLRPFNRHITEQYPARIF